MNDTLAGWLQILALVGALALTYRPLGDYMAHLLTTAKHRRAERAVYRLAGVDGDADQKWSAYLRGVLAFSAVSVVFLYAFLRLQNHLLLSLGMPAMHARTSPSTPPPPSSPTPTGSPTPASRRWATWCRWPAWRCRTSCPPPSASRWSPR